MMLSGVNVDDHVYGPPSQAPSLAREQRMLPTQVSEPRYTLVPVDTRWYTLVVLLVTWSQLLVKRIPIQVDMEGSDFDGCCSCPSTVVLLFVLDDVHDQSRPLLTDYSLLCHCCVSSLFKLNVDRCCPPPETRLPPNSTLPTLLPPTPR